MSCWPTSCARLPTFSWCSMRMATASRHIARVAKTLLKLEKPIDEIVRNEGLKGVVELPGIGRGIETAIVETVTTGRWIQLDRLSEALEPEQLFRTVPGIGPELAARIHNELKCRCAGATGAGCPRWPPGACSGRWCTPRARHHRRPDRFGHRHFQRPPHSSGPPIALLLDVGREYRTKAAQGNLRTIAPKRFNPKGEAWLPVLHASRGAWQFTLLFSNTQRAHELQDERLGRGLFPR
jgi:hypothetical protein